MNYLNEKQQNEYNFWKWYELYGKAKEIPEMDQLT